MRLKTDIRASALLRQAEAAGLFGMVLRRGDPEGGVLFVLTREPGAIRLHAERGGGFEPRTEAAAGDEEARAVIAREAEFDRDLWVVEIEGRGAETLLKAFAS